MSERFGQTAAVVQRIHQQPAQQLDFIDQRQYFTCIDVFFLSTMHVHKFISVVHCLFGDLSNLPINMI